MKILIADDDHNLRTVLTKELSEGRNEVEGVESGTWAIELLERDEYDVLLLDLNMPGLGGMDVLKKIKTLELSTEVIILTAYSTLSTAVEAMKLGAYDYLTKPFKVEELRAIIGKAYEKKTLINENLALKTQIKRQSQSHQIVTKNPAMLELLENLKILAESEFPVLISGESGVGKELAANAIHQASPRGEGPFVPINCGAIPEAMLESELFGYERGAFTGAFSKKLGLLEIANYGTLFLDEICELTSSLQGKLLRVIETGKFFRLGGVKETSTNIKLISATNKDIKGEIERGSLRPDLYYRISTLTLPIPPLRDRKEDIPLLVENMIKSKPDFKNKRFSEKALNILTSYPWPGNVRELQNVVYRTLLLSKNNIIDSSDLPDDLNPDAKAPGKKLEDIEREYILKVLKEVEGHKGKAAEILGIDPKTLYRKLFGYGVKE
jgi:DNA-binding NtrC family response regulator